MTRITEAQVEAALEADVAVLSEALGEPLKWPGSFCDCRRIVIRKGMRAALEAAAPLAPPDAAVEAAVLAERERCREIAILEGRRCAENIALHRPTSTGSTGALCLEIGGKASADAIVAAIQARSAAPKTGSGR